jgi:predicted O-methyltransferase YrrM
MEIYNILCSIPSDINEHLPTIKNLASECDVVTEMGTRYVVSTWALVYANPKKIICYDINEDFFNEGKKNIYEICKENDIDFSFNRADTLNLDIEKTDLLLIDTLHTYFQLFSELSLHSKNVNKYIIMHDTVSFGHCDEQIYNHASQIVKNNNQTTKSGLVTAIDDFLKTEEGLNWRIDRIYTNNNGLTVLARNK